MQLPHAINELYSKYRINEVSKQIPFSDANTILAILIFVVAED